MIDRKERNRQIKHLLRFFQFHSKPKPSQADLHTAMVWTVRSTSHRHLAGMRLLDHRDAIEVGTCEGDAQPYPAGRLRELAIALVARTSEAENRCLWIMGPSAAWIAVGDVQSLRRGLKAAVRRRRSVITADVTARRKVRLDPERCRGRYAYLGKLRFHCARLLPDDRVEVTVDPHCAFTIPPTMIECHCKQNDYATKPIRIARDELSGTSYTFDRKSLEIDNA